MHPGPGDRGANIRAEFPAFIGRTLKEGDKQLTRQKSAICHGRQVSWEGKTEQDQNTEGAAHTVKWEMAR